MKDRRSTLSPLAVIMVLASFLQSAILQPVFAQPSLISTDGRISPGTVFVPASIVPASNMAEITIGGIYISGNRKTKAYIIERELSFKSGDTVSLSALVSSFRRAREQLINTKLFNEAVIYIKSFRGIVADIQIEVKERWYFFPLPYAKPVDRNLTAWAEKDYSLSRLNYGMRLSYHNFTGRNDNLRVWLITGYSHQYELAYDQPYAGRSLKHGFGFGFIYSERNELDALTVNNQQYFINSDTIPFAGRNLTNQLGFSLRYFYRPALHTRYFVKLGFYRVRIDSAVSVWNPHYFPNDRKQIFYPELSYVMNYSDADYIPYPLKGVLFETGLTRRGIDAGMNLWQVYIKATRGWNLADRTWFGIQNWSMLKLPFEQPFYNQSFLGYGDLYMRGLDKYVVDGVAGFVVRNNLYRELFNFSLPFTRIPSHDRIPIRILARAFSDFGYVYNKNFTANSLANRMLYTAGFGLDFVTFYDLTVKFDYSFNQLGQNGLFLHVRNDF